MMNKILKSIFKYFGIKQAKRKYTKKAYYWYDVKGNRDKKKMEKQGG